MTTTIDRCPNNSVKSRMASRKGFSLVEVIIATSLGMMVSAAVISSFLFIARSSSSIINYTDMNKESRSGLEAFGRDIRSAKTISSGFTSTEFTITKYDDDTVSYLYRPSEPTKPLVRIGSSGDETVVMKGIQDLTFYYYNLQGSQATVPLEVKQIQLQLKLARKAGSLDNTDHVISARFILRNKKVSN